MFVFVSVKLNKPFQFNKFIIFPAGGSVLLFKDRLVFLNKHIYEICFY